MAEWQGRKGRPWRRVIEQLKRISNVCWICGHPIDLSLPAEDPMSFTADKLIPRSLGGPPTLDNARPAHRRCNSKRGNNIDFKPPLRTSRAW
ncbi:HNH endonuclease [Prauserella flavalba]|uniref:HNH endonuclease n=1 Tax=Prauserella flavalba TaxID=1477506 RepID=UPI0036E891CE